MRAAVDTCLENAPKLSSVYTRGAAIAYLPAPPLDEARNDHAVGDLH